MDIEYRDNMFNIERFFGECHFNINSKDDWNSITIPSVRSQCILLYNNNK